MKVLFVINSLHSKGNGLCAAVKRNIRELEKRGIEVRVLSGRNKTGKRQPEYELDDLTIIGFDSIISKQGYQFSKTNKKVIKEALEWADVVHIEEPFNIQIATTRLAKKMNVPCVATYHLHPENLLASVKLSWSKLINGGLMLAWRNLVFNRCKIVHAPTKNVEDRLRKWKYKAEIRTFSNGLALDDLMHVEKEYIKKDTYNIVSIGRYSYEKDLITIIKSLNYSKYKDKIKLILAGRGPIEKGLRRYADKLYKKGIIKYPVEFGFHTLEELQQIAKDADLYIHGAFVEVEGLSCMEAIQTGLVPIIAKGNLTATSQFALDEKSTFKTRDPKDLANKIDYWLSDDDRRFKESKKYIGLGKEYSIDKSIDEMIKMYEDALK